MSENHFDELINSHIKYAGMMMLSRLAEEAPTDEELAAAFIPCEELDRLVLPEINKEVGKRKLKRTLLLAARSVAIFFIFIVVSAFAISNSKALTAKFLNLFIAENNVSVDFSFSESGTRANSTSDASLFDYISPGYLPDGYVLRESNSNESGALSRYFNETEAMLSISRFSLCASHQIDNEDTNIYEIEVLGYPALVLETPDYNFLFFTNDSYEYKITANLDIEELILIAEELP